MVVELRPTPAAPTIDACVAELRQRLGLSRPELARTVLVGHSIGCQAILRFLQWLPAGASVASALCVAGWWQLDERASPMPQPLLPWLEPPADLPRIVRACKRFATLLSDDDPYTADQQANRLKWEQNLGAAVRMVRSAGHFTAVHQPEVLAAVNELFDGQ